MATNHKVVKLLNGLLTIELRAINQYFTDSKLAGHWGYDHLAETLRAASFEEMRDAEELMDRILLLDGLPNLQRIEAFKIGETVPEQLRLALELEVRAVDEIGKGIDECEHAGDHGTAELLRSILVDEEQQVDWLRTQLQLIEQIGEANYLAQQVRG